MIKIVDGAYFLPHRGSLSMYEGYHLIPPEFESWFVQLQSHSHTEGCITRAAGSLWATTHSTDTYRRHSEADEESCRQTELSAAVCERFWWVEMHWHSTAILAVIIRELTTSFRAQGLWLWSKMGLWHSVGLERPGDSLTLVWGDTPHTRAPVLKYSFTEAVLEMWQDEEGKKRKIETKQKQKKKKITAESDNGLVSHRWRWLCYRRGIIIHEITSRLYMSQ